MHTTNSIGVMVARMRGGEMRGGVSQVQCLPCFAFYLVFFLGVIYEHEHMDLSYDGWDGMGWDGL